MQPNPLLGGFQPLASIPQYTVGANLFGSLGGPSMPAPAGSAPLVYFKNPHPANKDPLFISMFMAELTASPQIIDVLVGLGDFQNNKHSIHNGCPTSKPGRDGECDDCYSGDTEYEMNSISVFGDVWKRAYAKWCEKTGYKTPAKSPVESDAEDSE